MNQFVGRKTELKQLNALHQMTSASFVVIRGRRRIGKSRLVGEFAKDQKFYKFTGLAPLEGTTAQDQRDEFSERLRQLFHLPISIKADDWSTLFYLLSEKIQNGRIILLFDEISWMAMGDENFLGKLKTAWDDLFSQNPQLILIVCGSVSAWIKENIIESTAFLGRINLDILLNELLLEDCNQFWGNQAQGVSAYEKLKLLSILGGIPRYLELMRPQLSAEENIRTLCFTKESLLIKEFKHIFIDIFGKRSNLYQQITLLLVSGPKDTRQLGELKELTLTGTLTGYLNDLKQAGFITRDYTWSLKTGKASKLNRFRLKDNYLRFYLKYILPNLEKIKKGYFENRSIMSLPGWDTIMGLQFENLVLNNCKKIISILGLRQEDLIFDNPFFQRKTARQKGVQIDYLIQTRFNCVYICEIKFSRFEIQADIIPEMREKIKRLNLPKGFSYRTVLIHVNGVREDVVDSRFFAEIINFSEMLEKT